MRRRVALVTFLLLSALGAACADESSTPAANIVPNQDAGGTTNNGNTGGTGPTGTGGSSTSSAPTGCTPACGTGTTCRDGNCVPVSTPSAGGVIGGPCGRAADCGERLCLSPKNYPQGYCSKVCGGDIISQGEPCPGGATCVQLGEAASFCLDLCDSNTDCRAGYVCGANGTVKACVPKCKSSDECDQGQSCNTTSGLCEKSSTPLVGTVGAPCTADAQCASNTCLDPTGSIFVGGYCLDTCTKADVGKPCGNNHGVCIDISTTTNEGYACFAACETGTDCRKEYLCSVEADPSSGAGFCVPRCDHYACDMGETCDTSVGVCVPGTAATSTGSEVTHVDLGTVTTGPDDADLVEVTVDVPPGAVSFSVVNQAADKNTEVLLAGIEDPKGKLVFNITDPASTDYKSYHGGFLSGGGGMLYPNAPRLPLIPGKYKLTYGSREKTTTKMDALIKRQSGVISGGNLPVVFWFTKNKYLNATTAQTDARFQEVVSITSQIYGAIGIKLGPFVYKDVSGPNAEKWALISDFTELGPLFENTNDSPEKALNFFMIDGFTFNGGATILGVSGGIPGPSAYPSLRHGGVAVALSNLGGKTGVFAETLAHEGGHFLGLWHTSERTGTAFDPLLDTPECTLDADRNNDKLVSGAECEKIDAANLMFWSTASVPQRTLTNDQRFVLLRNPSVQ
jgi:hypothetical protein